jgi:hypothetical protein
MFKTFYETGNLFSMYLISMYLIEFNFLDEFQLICILIIIFISFIHMCIQCLGQNLLN